MTDFKKAEEKIKKHAAIETCALLWVDNSLFHGINDVVLVVKKSEDYSGKPEDMLKEEILAYSRDILSPSELPPHIIFVDDIPITTLGRIDKKALHKKITSGFETQKS